MQKYPFNNKMYLFIFISTTPDAVSGNCVKLQKQPPAAAVVRKESGIPASVKNVHSNKVPIVCKANICRKVHQAAAAMIFYLQ